MLALQYDGQRIEGWLIIGADRLAGDVFNRPGHQDGSRIVTSPVVEVRVLGAGAWSDASLVAFTESGSAYRLGKPSRAFGTDRAREFIRSRLDGLHLAPDARDSEFDPEATVILAAVDTSIQHLETIDLYESSFKPL